MTKRLHNRKQKPQEKIKNPFTLNLNYRECETSVVHMETIVIIVWRENKISTVRTAQNMCTWFNNVTTKTEKQVPHLLQ